MIAKIKLTLEQDEQRGTNEGMQETIELLAALDTLPIQQIVVTLECEEVIAENYREKLRLGLKRRPIGIIAKIKTTSEEQIIVVPPTTPMDQHFGDLTREKTAGERVMDFLVAREQRAAGAGDENLFNDDE